MKGTQLDLESEARPREGKGRVGVQLDLEEYISSLDLPHKQASLLSAPEWRSQAHGAMKKGLYKLALDRFNNALKVSLCPKEQSLLKLEIYACETLLNGDK